ncbi:sortase A [Planomicrobium stackebrandtii]|uniref:Sortase A n=1 Tax=Planomicrobium stackebrandtii TaxID=253160 RepID=A0ABU0GU77_9BACL|nr:class D sortase [Planomicrobium stackebrandtii]MDQ0428910.1 sortase A [Planomicrobium stackebrandtii]
MMKDKHEKKRSKKPLLLSLSIALIILGLWFSTTSTATFVKGYMLYKTGNVEAKDFSNKPEAQPPALAEELEIPEEPEAAEEQIEEPTTDSVLHSEYPKTPEIGDLMGELIIPKLEASLPIIHGTNEDELEKGVGHFAESVLPGENDNSVLSGHRDTVFRELGEVGKGDLLIVKTHSGTFTYKVRQVRIVDEDDRTVIVPKPKATLTVSTCYPFDFVGYAPDRYILVADLVSSE